MRSDSPSEEGDGSDFNEKTELELVGADEISSVKSERGGGGSGSVPRGEVL